METIVKPKWYLDFQWEHPSWRFFIGKVAYREGRTEFLCINIGLYFIDFGRAY
jgi:hypothetical protein